MLDRKIEKAGLQGNYVNQSCLLQQELALIQLELAERLGIVQCFSIAGKDVRPLAAERQLVLPPLAKGCCLIPETARDFIAYWIENCVHASEADSTVGAEQDVSILTGRCLETASTLGLSKAALEQEVGNLSAYIGSKLVVVNSLERTRRV